LELPRARKAALKPVVHCITCPAPGCAAQSRAVSERKSALQLHKRDFQCCVCSYDFGTSERRAVLCSCSHSICLSCSEAWLGLRAGPRDGDIIFPGFAPPPTQPAASPCPYKCKCVDTSTVDNCFVLELVSAGFCGHAKLRSQCKECGGGSICTHGRKRTRCKECGGGSICKHGREKSKCKDCGGGSICTHGMKRSKCKDCGGGGICAHGRQRSRSKDFGGGGICTHGRRKSLCKDCGGGGICTHGRVRSRCKDCGPAAASRQAADALSRNFVRVSFGLLVVGMNLLLFA
jgi:hypothetical protein